MLTLCTEFGSKDFTDKQQAIKAFENLQSKGKEAALYEGEKLIKKTGIELTQNLI